MSGRKRKAIELLFDNTEGILLHAVNTMCLFLIMEQQAVRKWVKKQSDRVKMLFCENLRGLLI
jgi:hypothetical protein